MAALSFPPQIDGPSVMRALTLRRGFREEIGSWKIICN
ncbi:Uncharacterised protein [Mycobacteroides abscessus subsp. abscessus]|nr:Uncharacterised protein [Mycobacteroides abscessus subsp. abscessus]